MVHRAQDTRLLIALAKAEKEYAACLTGLLNASQASFAALTTFAASCPPGQAQTVINVVGALNGAEDALMKYAGVVDTWRADLNLLKKSEDEVAGILRDREILIGRVVKASSKQRTSRDSVLGMSLSSASSTVQDPNSSVATLGGGAPAGGGSVKLGLAQAELQACEAHLALKEQDLEKIRVRAVIGGLQRRCKALVECGWMWGEKGKEALRVLETSSNSANDDERAPHANGIAKHRRAATLPLVSDNGSQLSVTPSQSASQILPPGSDSSAEPSQRPVFDESRGTFSIDIPAAHSIDDHDAMHHNIPSSRLIVEGAGHKVDSSGSDEGGKPEAHKNKPFTHPPRDASERRAMPEKRHTLTVLPSDTATIRSTSTLRPSSAHQPPFRLHKQKPASDIGPGLVAFKPGDPAGMPYGRAHTTSGSLLGTITGLFKGKRASTGYDGVYTGPTAASFSHGWQTRTNRNLARQLSSSEEDLPSSVKRRSRPFGEEESHRHRRRSTTPPLPPKSTERSPDKGKARAAPAVPGPTSATGYAPRLMHERSSSSMRSRETAANTALNARTNGGGYVHDEEHPSVGRSDSFRSATGSGIVSGRRRDPQAGNPLNMGEVTRQSGGGGLVLSSAKLEVVRAPPSVTQAPVLLGPSPSPLVLPSARKASSGPGPQSAPSPPPKQGTGNAGGVSFSSIPTSPRSVAFSTPSANGELPRPLKSALRNSGLSPTPSPVPAIHGSVTASTPSSSGTPTNPTSARLPEVHSPTPRLPSAASMPWVVLPRPNRLSEIPASNRTSMVSENEYETCEEFVDAEEGTGSDTPPAVPTPPLPAAEKPKNLPPEGEHQTSLPAQRTLANGTPPVDTSVSSTSTRRGKSVRMIIHPTVTVSAPEEDTEPPTPPAYNKHEWSKLTASKQSHSRSTSGSGTSHRSEVSRSTMPSAWETRVEHQRSSWDNSEPEDEDYRSAKSALQRASAL